MNSSKISLHKYVEEQFKKLDDDLSEKKMLTDSRAYYYTRGARDALEDVIRQIHILQNWGDRWEFLPDALPIGHGYTCGWCEWGRDQYQGLTEYNNHVFETGHEGERKPEET